MALFWLNVSLLLISTALGYSTVSASNTKVSDQKIDLTHPELQRFIATLPQQDQDLLQRYPSKAALLLAALHHKGGEGDNVGAVRTEHKRSVGEDKSAKWNEINEQLELFFQRDTSKYLADN